MRPLLKVVALASATHPDAALLALQAELAAADQAWEALYSKQIAAEDACFAAVPPPPKEPNLDSDTIRKAFLSGEALSPETVQSLRAYDQANKARREAMEQAEHDSGLKAAEEAVNAADHVRLAIRDKIVSTRARTLARPDLQGAIRGDALSGRPRRGRHALDRRGPSRHGRRNLSEATGSFAHQLP